MDIFWTLLIGFLAGLVARIFSPVKNHVGIIITTLLGIVGAVFATWLGQYIGLYQTGEKAGFLGAVVGAFLLLAIYRFVFEGRNR